jgi:ribulose-5-phosphate 4-epimerase/fuculose-1-phosphate aldolase
MYEAEKALIVSEVEQMVRGSLLDRLGGSLSLRTNDGNVLVTPTTASFRRWEITSEEIVVLDSKGELIEGGAYKAAAAAPLFLHIYDKFPEVGAIAHSHCLYSLVYASAGMSIPVSTGGADIMGEIPCIRPDDGDTAVKERELREKAIAYVPSGFVQRSEIYAVNTRLGPLIDSLVEARRAELKRHGLAFTLHRHGLVVMARHLKEATENVERIETSAKVSYLKKAINLE